MRESNEIQAALDAIKAAGGDLRSAKAKALRGELKIALGYEAGTHNEDGTPKKPLTTTETSNPMPITAPVLASSDIAFVNDALSKLVLEGKAGKPERCYSDLRSALHVKHILEDAAGLVPTGRIALPHWNTLGRDKDTGEFFKPGENQAIVDGLEQRGVPSRPAPKNAPPVVTTREGQPIDFRRSRTLNEPDGPAEFLNADESEAVATSK